MDLKTYLNEVANLEVKRILRENFVKNGLIQKLESFKTPEQTFEYLESVFGHTPYGGQGRITYMMNDTMVLKFAYDGAFDQNEIEVKNALCLGEQYAVKVLHHHPKFWWLVEERLQPMTADQLNREVYKLTGVQVHGTFDFPDAIQTEIHEPVNRKAVVINQDLMKNSWYANLIQGLKNCNVSSSDFHFQNWGIRPSTGEMVLLDLGFQRGT